MVVKTFDHYFSYSVYSVKTKKTYQIFARLPKCAMPDHMKGRVSGLKCSKHSYDFLHKEKNLRK